jgi:hypothetical protein
MLLRFAPAIGISCSTWEEKPFRLTDDRNSGRRSITAIWLKKEMTGGGVEIDEDGANTIREQMNWAHNLHHFSCVRGRDSLRTAEKRFSAVAGWIWIATKGIETAGFAIPLTAA